MIILLVVGGYSPPSSLLRTGLTEKDRHFHAGTRPRLASAPCERPARRRSSQDRPDAEVPASRDEHRVGRLVLSRGRDTLAGGSLDLRVGRSRAARPARRLAPGCPRLQSSSLPGPRARRSSIAAVARAEAARLLPGASGTSRENR